MNKDDKRDYDHIMYIDDMRVSLSSYDNNDEDRNVSIADVVRFIIDISIDDEEDLETYRVY